MATYAVLGATGNTGIALTKLLLKTPDARVHAYCRNKAKLMNNIPEATENKRLEVFEGNIRDVDLFVRCLKGCRVVFLTITSNDNLPGCRLSQDSVTTAINALKKIKVDSNNNIEMPKMVLLSSATIDPHLNRNMPKIFTPIMKTAASNIYKDLIVAEKLLRDEQDWLSSIFIKPGGLSIDEQRGHKLSFDDQESFISYYDLAAAMIEAGDDSQGLYDMQNVSVVNTGGSAKFPRGTPLCILVGLLRHFFPWMHPYLPTTGPA